MNTEIQDGAEEEVEVESGVNDIEETVSSVAKETMVGDLRDVCLQIIRNPKLTGKAWNDMNEAQQRDVAQQITSRVSDAVVKSVQIIAANGQRQIIGVLEQVVVKDGIKAVIKCSQHDELRHELMDAAGDAVSIVITGAEAFIGGGEKVKIDKDQPDLIEEEADQPETIEREEETDVGYDNSTGEIHDDAEVEAIDQASSQLT